MADPNPELRTGIHSLWEEGLLFDYTIEVEGHEFRAHKSVLASMSGYFKVLLTNGMLESRQDRLKLQGFGSLAMQNMVEFIYQRKFGDTKASSDELFSLSTYLQIPSAVKVCTKELCKGLTPENCLDMFNLFMAHHVTEGTERVTTYIKTNIDAVLELHRVVDLPFQLVSQLHDCFGRSEWDLFCSLRDWVNADYDNRTQHVDGLMSNVRFPLMTPAQIQALKKENIYTEVPGMWHDLIEKASKYHRMPIHKKVLDTSKQTQVRTKASPVCFPVGDKKSGFHVLHNERSWEEHEGFLTPMFSSSLVTVVVNNFLIVYDELKSEEGMYIFDPRAMTWSEMAALGGLSPCVDFALVHHDQHLYAMGGLMGNYVTSHINRYDFQRNKWTVLTTQMPQVVCKHAACVVQDTIFVSGGRNSLEGNDTTTVHSLDLSTTTWMDKAPLLNATSRHQMELVAMVKSMAAIVILSQDLRLQMYSVAKDQWSWYNLLPSHTSLYTRNTNSAILQGGDCLWLLNVTLEGDPTQVNWAVNRAGGLVSNLRIEHGVCFNFGSQLGIIPGRFPVYVEGALVKKYFTSQLSIPLHSRTDRVVARPCRDPIYLNMRHIPA